MFFFYVMLLYLISMISYLSSLLLFYFCLISIFANILFSPSSFRVVLVPQNQQNVCFPSKGWLSWHTGSINQAILRQQSVTACSCGGRSQTILVFCCCFRLSTSSAGDLTGKTLQEDWCPLHGLPEAQLQHSFFWFEMHLHLTVRPHYLDLCACNQYMLILCARRLKDKFNANLKDFLPVWRKNLFILHVKFVKYIVGIAISPCLLLRVKC